MGVVPLGHGSGRCGGGVRELADKVLHVTTHVSRLLSRLFPK